VALTARLLAELDRQHGRFHGLALADRTPQPGIESEWLTRKRFASASADVAKELERRRLTELEDYARWRKDGRQARRRG
jgi:hypothetical protein